ncbi:response regulator [Pedosphaera parvula]|nr:response regulator [Pedosphaera parvula]
MQPTILLVEDNAEDYLLFKQAIARVYPQAGLHLAPDFPTALHYLYGSGPYRDRELFPFPSCVFVDLTLPAIPGKALVKWIREQKEFKKLLIVVLTGSRDGKDIAELYRLGANSFISKSGDVEEMAKTLRDMNSFWVAHNLIADFSASVPNPGKPSADTRGASFFYIKPDWPDFEPPATP